MNLSAANLSAEHCRPGFVQPVVKTMLLIFLLMVTCRPGLALQLNQDVCRERAKELGVTIRSNTDGENGVKVWLEFVPAGALKNFSHVDLEIDADGKRLVSAPLLTSGPTAEKVSVHFSADPAYLATSVLTIVVEDEARERSGFRFKVKDFLEPKKSAEALPVYETAEQIKAMPAVKATLMEKGPCYSVFKGADGKQFVIGTPGSGPQAGRFFRTLEVGKAYELPRAFLDYQKR
jgi:hypothetical protein